MSENVAKTYNTTYDLGYLTMFDSNPLKVEDSTDKKFEKELFEVTKSNIMKFWHTLFALKKEKDEVLDDKLEEHKIYEFDKSEWLIDLPEKTSVLPRHKKLPDAKAETRFQKYMKEKGFQKKVKRSRMVYDEATQQMLPRYGPYSIKKAREQVDVIREVKPGENPYDDPFLKSKLEKKMKFEKQKYQEMRNKLEGKGLSVKKIVNKEEVIQNKFKTMNQRTKERKKNNTKVLEIAQKSTASMGNFDTKAHKLEPEMKLKQKRHIKPFNDLKKEKERDLDMLEFVAKTGGSKKVKK